MLSAGASCKCFFHCFIRVLKSNTLTACPPSLLCIMSSKHLTMFCTWGSRDEHVDKSDGYPCALPSPASSKHQEESRPETSPVYGTTRHLTLQRPSETVADIHSRQSMFSLTPSCDVRTVALSPSDTKDTRELRNIREFVCAPFSRTRVWRLW